MMWGLRDFNGTESCNFPAKEHMIIAVMEGTLFLEGIPLEN